MASSLFAEPPCLRYLLQSLVIDTWYEDGALFKILVVFCVVQALLGDDELVEKEGFGNGKKEASNFIPDRES